MKSKIKSITICLLCIVLIAGVAAGIILGVNTMNAVKALRTDTTDAVNAVNETLASYINANEDVAQEDDVTIADQYVIKSTLNISDAYKSGDRSKLNDKEKETLDMASSALDGIIKDGMTDYEKEQAVYDWMTSELQNDKGLLVVIPTTQADCDNPYGVLKYHNAVCVGYATTLRLFMQMLNIECMVVHNTELYHSWDLIKLDGEWYHTDIYSDAGTGNYANFNMNDTICGTTGHDWNRSFFPAAEGIKYNYAYQHKQTADDIYGIAAIIKTGIDEKKGSISIGFSSGVTQNDAVIAENMLNNINNIIGGGMSDSYLYMSWSWLSVSADEFILNINISGYNTSTDGNITAEESEKISDAIKDAFGVDISDNGGIYRDATQAVPDAGR